MKREISVSALLTTAMVLLTMSVDFFSKEGFVVEGIASGAIGIALLVTAIFLFNAGIIEEAKKELKK